MTPRRKRMALVAFIIIGIGIAAALLLQAFQGNIQLYISPSEVVAGKSPQDRSFRLGGLVVDGSVSRDPESLKVNFDLTDTKETITVEFEGILPDLFREGQGIVTQGRLREDGIFVASEVLAKHDENYMPPEVQRSLEEAGIDSPHTNNKASE